MRRVSSPITVFQCPSGVAFDFYAVYIISLFLMGHKLADFIFFGTNLRYVDAIILLATSEAELQELVDRLDRVNRENRLLINVDKTKAIASDGIACRVLIQNEQLEQMDTFPYLGSLITKDRECTTEFRTRLNRGQAIRASLQKIWESHSIPISTKIRLMKAQVWSVVTYGCESWTLRKNEETRLVAFEMKGFRKILRVSWTANKTR